MLKQNAGYLLILLSLLSGCTRFDPRAGFPDVKATVEARTGRRVANYSGSVPDASAAKEIHSLLGGTLTADKAIQAALLNNRELQTIYADLGVARADLVQAGLLRNPVFDGSISFPVQGGRPDLNLGAAMSFLDVFYRPLRKRVAASRFEETKLRVTGDVLDFAATVQSSFYRHQADEQMLDLNQTIARALALSFDAAHRLHAAGNITDLDLAKERASLEEAKLRLRLAEVAVRQSRETLNILMGLWGQQTVWHVERRLPDLPKHPLPLTDLESRSLTPSLDLAAARQRLITAGEQAGLHETTALFPEGESGAAAEREDGEWEAGPSIEVPIPLADQGQTRIGRSQVELYKARQEYYAMAVRIRSRARSLQDRLQGAQDRATYYRDVLLPLRERIVNETQLQYNAMQVGIFDLLRAREQQIRSAVDYVETLLDYWLAHTDFELLLSGRLPKQDDFSAMDIRNRPNTSGENAGH